MKDESVLTRQMFCERCFKANRPYKDNTFIVCGTNGFHVRQVSKYVPPDKKGFTPHLVAAYKLLDDKNIAINRVCCVVGCGVSLKDDVFTYLKVSYEQVLLVDWNALVKNKDLGYFLD